MIFLRWRILDKQTMLLYNDCQAVMGAGHVGDGAEEMTTRSLKRLNEFTVVDENTGNRYYGCHQEWYGDAWQRRAGCGPTVATTLYFYQNRLWQRSNTKQSWLQLMNEVWDYVTPSSGGMPTTTMFFTAVLSYTRAKGLDVEHYHCELPEDRACRPTMPHVLEFIESGLQADAPVAFLNLCNGAVQNLARWHWVTIVALEYETEADQATVTILDEGQLKKIDLSLWLKTTTKGGGFVYFTPKRQSFACQAKDTA